MPVECQTIQDEVDELDRERELVQDELQEAPPADRRGLMARLRSLETRLAGARDRLADCLAGPALPPHAPLEARFTGTATLTTTDGRASGPYVEQVRFNVLLDGSRTTIAIVSFPLISVSFDTGTVFGRNTTTITRRTGGTGSYNAGNIVLPLGLRFDHSLNVPFVEEDSDFDVVLSTAPPGSPVTPEPYGAVTLAGSGPFSGGILDGSTGTLTIAGSISAFTPPPPATVPDVREARRDNAIAEVEAAGFVARTTGPDRRDAWVYRQSPAPGTIAGRGRVVTLQLRTGPSN